jgi:hypothetical protein
MRLNRPVALSLLVLVAIVCPGPAAQDISVPASTSTPSALAPPLPTGPAADLDLVFTAEVAGYVEPCG